MPVFRPGAPVKSFMIHEVKDRRLKAAAELIDGRFGTRHNDWVSEKSIQQATQQLQKSDHGVFKDLSAYEIQILKDALLPADESRPTLRDFLRAEAPKPKGPFATAMETRAILDPSVRACAEAVAHNFGTGVTQINLSELREAQDAIAKGQVPDSIRDVPEFNLDNLAELELFLMTGKGGLVTQEGVTIGGQRFSEAFPLPGDPSDTAVIQKYGDFFDGCGYDLIFIEGPARDPHPQLYVVLNESGELKVKKNMSVQLGTEGAYQDLGRVIDTADVNNSLLESTVGFWGDVAKGLVKTIRGKLGKNLDTRVENAASNAADSMSKNGGAGSNNAMTSMLAAGAVGAGVGAALTTWMLPATAATVGAVSGFNIYDATMNRRRRDKSMIYHAMGVGVNQERPIR